MKLNPDPGGVQMLDNPRRIHEINTGSATHQGPVVYWMSRDQRVDGNWALNHGLELAMKNSCEFHVVFSLVDHFLGATRRHFDFMLRGLQEVESRLHDLGIPFHMLSGSPAEEIPRFVREFHVSHLVTDFDPLRIKRKWTDTVASAINIPFHQVDAHNIVPCRIAYPKRAFGAYVIRKPIMSRLPEYLTPFPSIQPVSQNVNYPTNPWDKLFAQVQKLGAPDPMDRFQPGYSAGMDMLQEFMEQRLDLYGECSNDPTRDAISHLSPYLHFGQISAQEVALRVQETGSPGAADFLEQLIVRRELSDKYCWHTPNYDSVDAFPEWALKTIEDHRSDPRDYIYELQQFEKAETHDVLWNAAQREMVMSGKMHNYMRMYWAKKILEWTPDAETAMEYAIMLNDTYSLDGRDPNGYAGIAWSVGGVHDRAWSERPVFGKIRYMNARGARRKFDVDEYVSRWF